MMSFLAMTVLAVALVAIFGAVAAVKWFLRKEGRIPEAEEGDQWRFGEGAKKALVWTLVFVFIGASALIVTKTVFNGSDYVNGILWVPIRTVTPVIILLIVVRALPWTIPPNEWRANKGIISFAFVCVLVLLVVLWLGFLSYGICEPPLHKAYDATVAYFNSH